MPATKIAGMIHSAISTPVEFGGVRAPKRLRPSVPGTNQNTRFTNGIRQARASQPVVPKSWQRWTVSMNEMTPTAIQPAGISTAPAWPRNPLSPPVRNMMSSGRPMV